MPAEVCVRLQLGCVLGFASPVSCFSEKSLSRGRQLMLQFRAGVEKVCVLLAAGGVWAKFPTSCTGAFPLQTSAANFLSLSPTPCGIRCGWVPVAMLMSEL